MPSWHGGANWARPADYGDSYFIFSYTLIVGGLWFLISVPRFFGAAKRAKRAAANTPVMADAAYGVPAAAGYVSPGYAPPPLGGPASAAPGYAPGSGDPFYSGPPAQPAQPAPPAQQASPHADWSSMPPPAGQPPVAPQGVQPRQMPPQSPPNPVWPNS
ncbi:MAG: hypothetical protein LBK95_17920 [Bifidobacteriaceae bacterium]|nr:hypothetical protein [Bifidobacteriaceae bacterium]